MLPNCLLLYSLCSPRNVIYAVFALKVASHVQYASCVIHSSSLFAFDYRVMSHVKPKKISYVFCYVEKH